MRSLRALTSSGLATLVRAHVVALAVIAGLLILYALAGFFLVPRIARAQIEDYVTGTLHRKISLGEIRFNPFAFDASIGGLRLGEADGSPLAAFRHLYVNAELASLWQRALVLKEVELSAPDVQLIIARDGSVNLARLAPPPAEPSEEEEAAPPRVRIGRLAVVDGRVGLEDRTHAQPFTAAVAPIQFVLIDFRTDLDYRNAYSFAGRTTSGEQLDWNGTFTVQPLGSSGRFKVQGLKLATLDAYLEDSLPFRLASGRASLAGSYRFALDPFALEVTMPGIAVRDAALAERGAAAANPPVTLPEINVQRVAFSFGKRDVGFERIDIAGARVTVSRDKDGTISLSRLFNFAAPAAAPTSQPAASPAVVPAASSAPARPASSASVSSASSAPAPEDPGAAQPGAAAATRAAPPAPATTSEDAGSNSKPPAVADSAGSASWNIHVDTIGVENAAVIASDRSVTPAAQFKLAPLAATIEGWSTNPDAKVHIASDVTINGEGRLTAQGELQMEPLGATLAIELSKFELPAIQPYLSQTTAMTLHSGQLGVKGDVSFAATPEDAPPLKFTGEVDVADLRTTDQLVNEDFVKWRDLSISGIRFGLNPDGLSIDRIVARQPYASVIIAADRTLNVAQVLAPAGENAGAAAGAKDAREGAERIAESNAAPRSPPAAESAKHTAAPKPASPPPRAGEGPGGGAEKSPALPIRIKRVIITGGSANFADYSIQPSFAAGILDLNGRISGLSSDPDSRAQVALQGKVDKYAPVDITGEVNLLSAATYTDLAMNFRNMELTTFNPYSGKFAGYNISRGKLSTELNYHVEDRKLLAEHHIVLDNLEFGEKTASKDAAPVPVKLAVALLKDRNGVIDIDLPVRGDLDNPRFRLGPIIWKAVLGLLKKIVTAPFAALGALFGGGEELAYVDFPPGQAGIAPAQAEKLTKLSKALVERPQLRLNVPLTFAADADGDAIARAALAARLPEDMRAQPGPAGEKPEADEKTRRRQLKELERLYKEIVKSAPEYPPPPAAGGAPADDAGSAANAELDMKLDYLRKALLERLRPDENALNALARQRAQAVQDALLANPALNAQRVFITSGEAAASPIENGHVRMKMKLE